MTDTKCPHCESLFSCELSTGRYYACGTCTHETATFQSTHCELKMLRAKVAAQQELLKEAADAIAETVQMIHQYDEWHCEDFQPLLDMSRKLTRGY